MSRLNEMGSGKLTNYIIKAGKDIESHYDRRIANRRKHIETGDSLDHDLMKYTDNKIEKRNNGIRRAVDRLRKNHNLNEESGIIKAAKEVGPYVGQGAGSAAGIGFGMGSNMVGGAGLAAATGAAVSTAVGKVATGTETGRKVGKWIGQKVGTWPKDEEKKPIQESSIVPKRGLVFTHAQYLDSHNKPMKFIVTAVRGGVVWYAPYINGVRVGKAKDKCGVEEFSKRVMKEDAPTNCAGGGAVAGIGVNRPDNPNLNWGEPGRAGKFMPMLRRKKDFASMAVFEVSSKTFYNARVGKRKGAHWSKYLDEDASLEEIREYANSNPNKPIIIQNEMTGEMMYCRYGGKL